jgi:hypothetical protein
MIHHSALREEAQRCLRLARLTSDFRLAEELEAYARELEARASRLEGSNEANQPAR